MFWMRNKENSFPIRILIWRPGVKVRIISFHTCHNIMRVKPRSIALFNTLKSSVGSVLLSVCDKLRDWNVSSSRGFSLT